MPDKKFHNNIDLQKLELKNAVIHTSATPIGTPVEGQLYYNTADKVPYVYNGTSYRSLATDTLQLLTDTDFTGFVAGTDKQYMIWSSSSAKWIPGVIDLDLVDIADVSYPAPPTNGQALVYNTGTGKWEPTSIAAAGGGLGINNPGIARLVLSGATAVANLEAQATLKYFTGTNVFRLEGSTIAIPMYHALRPYDTLGASIAPGNVIAQYGMSGYIAGDSTSSSGGMRLVATQTHDPLIPLGTGTVVEFFSTINSALSPTTQMHISGTGCVVVNPSTYADDHAQADFYVNGGVAKRTRNVSNANVVVDASGFDHTIVLYVDDTNPYSITFPAPAVAYEGRELETISISINSEVITLQGPGNPFWSGGAQATLTSTNNGRVRKFRCININGTYYWIVLSSA